MGNQIGIIGLGKLGLPTALVFAKHGYDVIGVETHQPRLNEIKVNLTISEPLVNNGIREYVCRTEKLKVVDDISALSKVPVVFIIVATPSTEDGSFDVSQIKTALHQLHEVNEHVVAVIMSTINPDDMKAFKTIHKRVVYNPEFIAQGSIIRNLEHPKFVLIGSDDPEDSIFIEGIWSNIVEYAPIVKTTAVEAGIIKLSMNLNFNTGITFANTVGELCDEIGADSKTVLDTIYLDRRNYQKGLGYMGPCFPRDCKAFSAACREKALTKGVLFTGMLDTINDLIIFKEADSILFHHPKRVALLGVAYKEGVPYLYESQILKIINVLLKKDDSLEIFVFDPLAYDELASIYGKTDRVQVLPTLGGWITQADVIYVGLNNIEEQIKGVPRKEGSIILNPWRR